MIKPEEIGFSPLDTEVSPAVKSPRDNPNRLADISVDLSEERRDRWVRYLTVIGLVSNDSEKRKAVVQQLADFS